MWTRMTSQENSTALMYAATANAHDVAKLLIDKGSDVNATDQVCILRQQCQMQCNGITTGVNACALRGAHRRHAGNIACIQCMPTVRLSLEYKRMTMLIQCGRA